MKSQTIADLKHHQDHLIDLPLQPLLSSPSSSSFNEIYTTNPPPESFGISGKFPDMKDALHALFYCFVCFGCCTFILWICCFIIEALLLHRANNSEVRVTCPGFWDFMLISLLSPILIPLAFCIFSCMMWWSWYPFSGACMLILAIASLHITIVSSENGACIEAIRNTSPPLPWLIYIGWLKSVIYSAGSISILCSYYVNNKK